MNLSIPLSVALVLLSACTADTTISARRSAIATSSSTRPTEPEPPQVEQPIAEQAETDEPEPEPEFRREIDPALVGARSLRLKKSVWALASPFHDGERLGFLGGGTRVKYISSVVNDECVTAWIEIAPRGFVCVATRVSKRAPTVRSRRPRKALPGFYAIANKSARFYKKLEYALEERRGRKAKGDMVRRVGIVELEDGSQLWRTQTGEYVDPTELRRLWGSRFRGVDLDGPRAPALPIAFALSQRARGRIVVRREPNASARVRRRLRPRSVVTVLERSEDGAFTRIGEGAWVATGDLRIVGAAEPPEEVAEAERWIDVDLSKQLVVVYEGARPIFATLGSSGRAEDPTPQGIFRVTRKKLRTTMMSDRSKEQTYAAAVPWSTYFHEGFAFHAAYWHNGFGKARSHGCINLSPSDARTIFSLVGPELPAGWLVVYGHESQPGTVVRIRDSSADPTAPEIAGI